MFALIVTVLVLHCICGCLDVFVLLLDLWVFMVLGLVVFACLLSCLIGLCLNCAFETVSLFDYLEVGFGCYLLYWMC